jgi:hypothetical protein
VKRSWRLREGLCDLVLDIGPPGGGPSPASEEVLLGSFLQQVKSSGRGESERVFVELYAELFGAPPPGWPFAGEDVGRRWSFFDSLEGRLRDAVRRGWLRLRDGRPRAVLVALDASDDDVLGPLSEQAPESEEEPVPVSQSYDAASAFDFVEQDTQAAVLIAAAQRGVPFCEECARARSA